MNIYMFFYYLMHFIHFNITCLFKAFLKDKKMIKRIIVFQNIIALVDLLSQK